MFYCSSGGILPDVDSLFARQLEAVFGFGSVPKGGDGFMRILPVVLRSHVLFCFLEPAAGGGTAFRVVFFCRVFCVEK